MKTLLWLIVLECFILGLSITLPKPDHEKSNFKLLSEDVLKKKKTEEDIAEVVKSANKFGLDFYREFVRTENPAKNVAISPVSVTNVLAMLMLGAKGKTEQQLKTFLNPNYILKNDVEDGIKGIISTFYRFCANYSFGSTKDFDIDSGFSVDSFKGNNYEYNNGYLLSVVSKLYISNNIKIKEEFLQKIQPYLYDTDYSIAGYSLIDFVTDPHLMIDEINNYIAKHTMGKINNLVKTLCPKTKLFLLNAAYFSGKWEQEFSETHFESFYDINSHQTAVTMMSQTGPFQYAYNEEYKSKLLKLPFENKQLHIYIILPDNMQAFKSLEKGLNVTILDKLQSKMETTVVKINIPKFIIKGNYNFRKTIYNLGMKDLFTNLADLSGIAGKTGDLKVMSFLQGSYFEIKENGKEKQVETTYNEEEDIAEIFHANHPFFFYIVEYYTKVIVFMGRVMLPDMVE